MKMINTQKISVVISEYIKEAGLEDGLQRVRIFNAWDLVVGQFMAKATINKFFKNGTLYCTITSSIYRTQLYGNKSKIIMEINKMLNSNVVKEIVLK